MSNILQELEAEIKKAYKKWLENITLTSIVIIQKKPKKNSKK